MNDEQEPLSGVQWLLRTLNAGLVTSALGTLALVTSRGWLIPSLGPSILMQCYMPRSRESGWYPLVVGQFFGILAGVSATLVANAIGPPPDVVTHVLHLNQVVAAVLALLLTLVLQIAARALHPPAASTAMLWATGTVPLTLHHVLATAGAVAVVGLIGEPIRRWEAKRIPRRAG